jgi:hypothetical protein
MTLVEFIQARYTEIETTALAASPGPWHDDGGCVSSEAGQITDYGAYTRADGEPEEWEDQQRRADSAHIALHDPAYVLADIAANRAILKLHKRFQVETERPGCDLCSYRDLDEQLIGDWPCQTLHLLALPFADHPDYDEEWRP